MLIKMMTENDHLHRTRLDSDTDKQTIEIDHATLDCLWPASALDRFFKNTNVQCPSAQVSWQDATSINLTMSRRFRAAGDFLCSAHCLTFLISKLGEAGAGVSEVEVVGEVVAMASLYRVSAQISSQHLPVRVCMSVCVCTLVYTA